MGTIYQKVKAKLEQHESFRERRKRATGLMILTLRDLGLEGKKEFTIENLIEISKKYDSYRHEFDAVQKDYPNLRGQDYQDGKALAQAKQIEFGYTPGFYQDIKQTA